MSRDVKLARRLDSSQFGITHTMMIAPQFAIWTAAIVSLLIINGCNPIGAGSANVATDDARAMATANDTAVASHSFPFAHGVRIYVSAVNCEMNAEDALRLNALAATAGLAIEVVFTGITGNDTNIVRRAQADLGLTVPVRQIQRHEIEQYKSIGGATLPMALVVKGRQLKTIVTGESMPRTMSIVEASLSSTAPPSNNQSPEG